MASREDTTPAATPGNPKGPTVPVRTERFGDLDVPEGEIFSFPAGIPGFAKLKRFFMVEHRPGSPFRWVQSAEDPSVAFVVTDPMLVRHDYGATLRPSDLNIVDAQDGDELVLHVILSIGGDPVRVTANLKAPLVFNPRNHLATQVVLEGDPQMYALRYPVPTQPDAATAPAAEAASAQKSPRASSPALTTPPAP